MEDKSSTFSASSSPQSPLSAKKVLDKLKIIFEDENYAVLDKASGITVNRSDTTSGETTLQDLVEGENKIDKNDTDSDFRSRSGIVHRLDKETSGVIVVAKNSAAFRNLQAQFKERQVEKTYVALAHGEIKPQTGEINVPVGRLPWNRKRFGILAGGRNAITSYRVISNFHQKADHPLDDKSKASNETLTLVRLFPKTGRTHQIRVHLKYIGHPIFGDILYGGRKAARSDRKVISRMFLHAEEISFLDPGTGERRRFKSQLPEELEMFINNLEKVVN